MRVKTGARVAIELRDGYDGFAIILDHKVAGLPHFRCSAGTRALERHGVGACFARRAIDDAFKPQTGGRFNRPDRAASFAGMDAARFSASAT